MHTFIFSLPLGQAGGCWPMEVLLDVTWMFLPNFISFHPAISRETMLC